MSLIKWILPVVCASGTLFAQALGDLNSLISSANHYVSHGMGGTHDPKPLEICKVLGDAGGDPGLLMNRGVDVTHWTFLYRINNVAETGDIVLPKPHRSVTAECTKGVFGGFKYSGSMVTGVKSLEYSWVGISLDAAIGQLNALGYVRGFTKVTLERPANPHIPDEYVYVFNCPLERTLVALSTQNGALIWTESY